MFASMMPGAPVPSGPMFEPRTPVPVKTPSIEEARSDGDFKRIELKLTQMGLLMGALTLVVSLLSLRKVI